MRERECLIKKYEEVGIELAVCKIKIIIIKFKFSKLRLL